jgi:simple sugar transport system permease protein
MSDENQGPEVEGPEAEEGAVVESAGNGPGRRMWARITGAEGDWRSLILVPVLAVFTALVIGAIIIAVSDVDLLGLWGEDAGEAFRQTFSRIGDAYGGLFTGAFGSMRGISETLTWATPLILAGLAVAIGFRAGLFNIGAEGQMLMGGLLAVVIGFQFNLTIWLHLPLAILGGFIGGAIWGGIPGWLRAKTGAHEVITTIMFNWIAIRFVDFALKTTFIQREGRRDRISKDVLESAQLPKLLDWIDPQFRLNAGIIVALLAAWGVYWLLFKSTVGFEFRAVGANPDGAKYAGINVTRAYIMVMAVAGGLGGLAGSTQILGVLGNATPGFSANLGFDAIALALLGRSHPFGVVLAGVLFGALRAGGQQMQVASDVGIDLILVIQALIVVFIAAPELIRAIFRVRAGKAQEQITRGWAT